SSSACVRSRKTLVSAIPSLLMPVHSSAIEAAAVLERALKLAPVGAGIIMTPNAIASLLMVRRQGKSPERGVLRAHAKVEHRGRVRIPHPETWTVQANDLGEAGQ